MTWESFERADVLFREKLWLEGEIDNINATLREMKSSTEWKMEVRANASFPLLNIEHSGLLRDFLIMALKELENRVNAIEKEIDAL